MSQDLVILKTLASRKRYKAMHQAVPQSMLSEYTRNMLAWFNLYYETYPTHDTISVDQLKMLIKLRAPNADPEALQVTLFQADQLNAYVDAESMDGMANTLLGLDTAGKAAALAMRYQSGEAVDIVQELALLSTQAKRYVSGNDLTKYEDTSIAELLKQRADDTGLKFRRWHILRDGLRGLMPGTSISIAAPTDMGKTSAIADIVTDWAPQAVELFGLDRPILWFVNEGAAAEIVPRLYNAALNEDSEDNANSVVELGEEGFIQRYEKAIGAPRDYIRVKNIHGYTMAQCEQVIEAMRPCVVVWDMLANISLGTGGGGKDSRTADLETRWQLIREWAVIHGFISVATSQVSFEGLNMLHPPVSAMKDSKIGAQGAMDVAIMLGALTDPAFQDLRGVSTPKNKRGRPKQRSYLVGQLEFNRHTSRFRDNNDPIPGSAPSLPQTRPANSSAPTTPTQSMQSGPTRSASTGTATPMPATPPTVLPATLPTTLPSV